MAVFSVLIPVYNSEKYIQECVRSVLDQTFQNFEIILADDGSTDESGKICDQLSSCDKRITVIHQKNQGPAVARIAAFQKARGDYVIYMDSDDLWDKQLLEKIQAIIEKHDCDIVTFRLRYIDLKGKYLGELPPAYPRENVVYDIRSVIIKFLTEEVENSLCKRAVRRNCIDCSQIASLSGIKDIYLGEDMVQSFIMIKDCKNMVYLDQSLYYYRVNPHSLTHNLDIKPTIDIAKARQYLHIIIRQSKFNQAEYRKMLEKSFWERYLTDLVNVAALYDIKTLKKTVHEIKKLDIYKSTKKKVRGYSLSLKRKMLYFLEQSEWWTCFWLLARIYKRLIGNRGIG